MPSFTNIEHAQRLEKLQRLLSDKKIDLAILTQTSDIYYYTGSAQPLYLLVPAEGEPIMLARKAITRIEQEVSEIELAVFRGGKDLTNIISQRGLSAASRIGFTLDTVSYSSVMRFQKLFGNAEIIDITWDIRTLRMVKSEAEIAIQAEAAKKVSDWPKLISENIHPGITELELSAIIENDMRLRGHGCIVRCRREGIEVTGYGVCSSGLNSLAGTKFEGICTGQGLSSANPYGAGDYRIEPGTPIVLDYGFNLYGYIIDQTRMCSIGEPCDEVLRVYDSMLKVQQLIFDAMKPGAIWEDLYNIAFEAASEMGYADTFMGLGTEQVKFVAHGVGLELDEPPYFAPKMKYPLQSGMVIAVEPKVALPGVGVVGIEDTVVVRDDEIQCLTTCPRDFIVVK